MGLGTGIDEPAAHLLADFVQRGIGEDRLGGHCAKHLDAEPGKTALAEIFDEVVFIRVDFVDDDADQFDAFLVEERFVEGHLVDGLADAAFGDEQRFAAEQLGHPGV